MNGILFKSDMIKAIVEGRKTVTRRVAGLKEINREPDKYKLYAGQVADHSSFAFYSGEDNPLKFAEPRYQAGEVVYIKEAWRYFGGEEYEYLQDFKCVIYKNDVLVNLDIYKWHNPRTMPAWAARYHIQFTDVRAERLQEITHNDVIDEGIDLTKTNYPTTKYKALWNSINANWKRIYDRELGIYEFWQFPWCADDAKPIPKTTEHPERYHCVPNPWVFRYEFSPQ